MNEMTKELGKRSAPTNRLAREDWVDAAADSFALYGVDGVRVEKLAKALKVTKGSFYWHFRDRDELLDAILEKWRRQNTVGIIEFVGSTEPPLERLRQLAQMPFETSLVTDPMGLSLRLWARHDERPQKALAEVDDLRIRMKAQLYQACGFSAEEARARAILLYAYMRTAVTLVDGSLTELRTQCENLLLPPATPA